MQFQNMQKISIQFEIWQIKNTPEFRKMVLRDKNFSFSYWHPLDIRFNFMQNKARIIVMTTRLLS